MELSLTAAHPTAQRCAMPAGAWAKVLRSSRADYAALAIPFNMKMPPGFKYQMPVLDVRNPDAITFVVESDPPQLSVGCNVPRKLELQLMAVDLWQQAVWAQKQHHDQAELHAHIASALKKVQAVVRQMRKQQAGAAAADSAGEQAGTAGSAETWPVVKLPSPEEPGSGVRIEIQGPSQGAPGSSGSEPHVTHVQHLQRREPSVQPSAAPVAPAPAQQQLQQQTAEPVQADTTAAAEAAQQAADAESRTPKQPTLAADDASQQQPSQAAAVVLPDTVSAMAVAEVVQQAAEAESRPPKQPTPADDDASQQQPSQAAAVVLPDAAIQAAVEAKVEAAMAQHMVQVGSDLEAMQSALQEEARLTAESASRQMSDLRGEVQQATVTHQELHSQVARQEEAIQQLQQIVEGQVSRRDEGTRAGDVVESCWVRG